MNARLVQSQFSAAYSKKTSSTSGRLTIVVKVCYFFKYCSLPTIASCFSGPNYDIQLSIILLVAMGSVRVKLQVKSLQLFNLLLMA